MSGRSCRATPCQATAACGPRPPAGIARRPRDEGALDEVEGEGFANTQQFLSCQVHSGHALLAHRVSWRWITFAATFTRRTRRLGRRSLERYLNSHVRVRVRVVFRQFIRTVPGPEIFNYPRDCARVSDRPCDRAVPGVPACEAYRGRLEYVLVPLTVRSCSREQVQPSGLADKPHWMRDLLSGNPAGGGEFNLVGVLERALEVSCGHRKRPPVSATRLHLADSGRTLRLGCSVRLERVP
jgi:hypothetical protein